MNQSGLPSDNSVKVSIPNPKKKSWLVVIGVLIAIILIGEIIWARAYLKGLSLQTDTPSARTDAGVKQGSPSPTPLPKRLPQGRQEFSVSSKDATKGPQFSTIVIDPYDPRVGGSQTMTIAISGKLPVKSVSVTVATEKGRKSYPLTLASGEATNGVWEGKWNVDDTHDVVYNASFMAQDSTYTDTVTLTMR